MICGALANKTRIFVTYQLDLLHRVDRVVVVKSGKIAEIGTYEELMQAGLDFSELLIKHVGKDTPAKLDHRVKPRDKATRTTTVRSEITEYGSTSGKLMQMEHKQAGAVSWAIYNRYFSYGGMFLAGVVLAFYIFERASFASSDWWISYWAGAEIYDMKYLGIFLALGGATVLCGCGRAFSIVYTLMQAAAALHNSMLDRVLHAPMSFFDTTPVGRIINRFSKDLVYVDENLTTSFSNFMFTTLYVAAIAIVISIITPFFIVALLPLSYAYYYVQQYYLVSSREVQRLDSISKSPIYALFSETLQGITTIRSFGVHKKFVETSDKGVDKNARALFVVNSIGRWLSIRLELMCNFVVSLAALFCVMERNTLSSATAGLSLVYALQVTHFLNMTVRLSTEVETYIISVERILEYSDFAIEAPYGDQSNNLSPAWPSEGEIKFENLKLRYRSNLDFVLRGITATIKPREKIGIVGRTGAGKSSLFLALFRLVEATEGSIYIDNVNIAKIGLSDLRSRLAIIPQDPTLFIGTIRSNLDPFDSYGDSDIWATLESVHMKEAIQNLPDKLESSVVENGDNFSVGQRQLLCLGRALLRKSKILLMDEATAAVDMETDALIQKTIRDKFKDISVLTIAHRINTILDSDRVMVLDRGVIVEFDKPETLTNNTYSIFYSLLQESKLLAN